MTPARRSASAPRATSKTAETGRSKKSTGERKASAALDRKGTKPGRGERRSTEQQAAKAGARATRVRLLSGGNPQIAKASGETPVKAYVRAMPGWKREIGERLDALVTRHVAGVQKAVKWNSPFYGLDGRGWFLNFHCFTKFVRVAFFKGAALRPPPPGTSKQKDVRYLDLYEGAPIDEAQLVRWITQAAALPGWLA